MIGQPLQQFFTTLGPGMTLVDSYNEVLVDTLRYKVTFSLLSSTRFLGSLLSVVVIV